MGGGPTSGDSLSGEALVKDGIGVWIGEARAEARVRGRAAYPWTDGSGDRLGSRGFVSGGLRGRVWLDGWAWAPERLEWRSAGDRWDRGFVSGWARGGVGQSD